MTGDVSVGARDHAAEHEVMRGQLDGQARGLEELRHEIAQLRAQLSVVGYGSVSEPQRRKVAVPPVGTSAWALQPATEGRAEYADQHSSSEAKLALYRQ